jgi:hypothetical protein
MNFFIFSLFFFNKQKKKIQEKEKEKSGICAQ